MLTLIEQGAIRSLRSATPAKKLVLLCPSNTLAEVRNIVAVSDFKFEGESWRSPEGAEVLIRKHSDAPAKPPYLLEILGSGESIPEETSKNIDDWRKLCG